MGAKLRGKVISKWIKQAEKLLDNERDYLE